MKSIALVDLSSLRDVSSLDGVSVLSVHESTVIQYALFTLLYKLRDELDCSMRLPEGDERAESVAYLERTIAEIEDLLKRI